MRLHKLVRQAGSVVSMELASLVTMAERRTLGKQRSTLSGRSLAQWKVSEDPLSLEPLEHSTLPNGDRGKFSTGSDALISLICFHWLC